MPKVVRLRAKQELVERETAAAIVAQLSLYPPEKLPAQSRAAVLNALHRVTHPDNTESLWPGGFTMISREQTVAVWKAIRALPPEKRPHEVMFAFNMALANVRQDSGEIMLTRDQLAAEVGCAPGDVSKIMGTLERMGVIRRERRKVDGMQGPGMAVYFINPHVAWNGSLELRKQEARGVSQPTLRLVAVPSKSDT
jgi:DNA-binding Lrp family transcriptional regulator